MELNGGHNMPQERDKEELGSVGDSETVEEQEKEGFNNSDQKMIGSSNKKECLPTERGRNQQRREGKS